MFCKKGYCRYAGRKCWHLKVIEGMGYCKKKTNWKSIWWINNEKTGKPKNFHVRENVPISNIKAPSWCPKLKH